MARPGPLTGGEKETLQFSLNRHRDAVVWKAEGVWDEDLRRRMTSSGTNMIGLVKHLASVEYGWFCRTFGHPSDEVPLEEIEKDPEADMRAGPGETTVGLLEYYAKARAAADASIDQHGLEDTGTAWSGETVSMRWVLVHMIEETARHAGHLDILRELIDGATGDHRPA
jgi:uncharacterized damage-inducible protein DinB